MRFQSSSQVCEVSDLTRSGQNTGLYCKRRPGWFPLAATTCKRKQATGRVASHARRETFEDGHGRRGAGPGQCSNSLGYPCSIFRSLVTLSVIIDSFIPVVSPKFGTVAMAV